MTHNKGENTTKKTLKLTVKCCMHKLNTCMQCNELKILKIKKQMKKRKK